MFVGTRLLTVVIGRIDELIVFAERIHFDDRRAFGIFAVQRCVSVARRHGSRPKFLSRSRKAAEVIGRAIDNERFAEKSVSNGQFRSSPRTAFGHFEFVEEFLQINFR